MKVFSIQLLLEKIFFCVIKKADSLETAFKLLKLLVSKNQLTVKTI
jgi:hypothetical protein